MSGLNRELQMSKVDVRRAFSHGTGVTVSLSAILSVSLLLSACAPARIPAPVEVRNVGKSPTAQRSGSSAPNAPSASSNASTASSNSNADSLGPTPEGFYRVKRGDTLIGISLDHGVAWRDLALWNSIDNPNLIEVDQLLRVSFPNAPKTEVKSIAPSVTSARAAPTPQPAAPSAAVNSQGAQTANSAATKAATEAMTFSWPGKGQVITQFADPGYKGIAIAGNEGDPVSAAADGRIVYSGNGLRGYGNLVIIKHDGDFLTAYAHNKSILVNEGQMVKRGQKIAELGKTDSDVPKLHFEVRKSGKPVDPLKFLASR